MRESKYLKETIGNIEKLMSIPSLRTLDSSVLGRLLQLSRIRQYENEEKIIIEGSKEKWLYFLLSGEVKIMKGDKEITVLRRRGDLFGEMSILGDHERRASAISLGSSMCLSMDVSLIDKMSGKDRMTFCYILFRTFSEILTDRLNLANKENLILKEKLAKAGL